MKPRNHNDFRIRGLAWVVSKFGIDPEDFPLTTSGKKMEAEMEQVRNARWTPDSYFWNND